jgi:hypothetical protein
MMLRSLLLPVALLVSAPALAQGHAADSRQGQVEVPDFRGVAVSSGIHAEVKPGAKSVRLEGNPDDVARVKLEVKDGVLTTQVEKSSMFFSKGLKHVRLYVTNPRVESLAASGGSHLDAEATRSDTFDVAASGGSELNITGVDAKKLDVAASGGSELSLSGRTGELEVQGSGGSVIEAQKLQAESLDVTASGGTRVEAAPERSITGSLSGGSTVKAARKPQSFQVNSSGGSQVIYQ